MSGANYASFKRAVGSYLYTPRQTSISPLADVAALIAALGGNSGVLGFWDCRQGVTASSGNVSAWADARTVGGSLGLNTLSYFGSGTNPTWAGGSNPVITINGGATLSTGAGSPNYLPSGSGTFTLVAVASGPTTGAGLILGGINGNASDAYLQTATGPVWSGLFGTTGVSVNSAVGSSGLDTIALKQTSSTGAAVVTNNGTPVTGTIVTAANSTANLVVGSSGPSATAGKPLQWYALIALNFATSSGQDATIHSWAVTNHGSA